MIIDITQEIFTCKTWPGDPVPEMNRFLSMEKGDVNNASAFSMCAHNGTHVDTPLHFIRDGAAIDQVGLEPFVGDCYVSRRQGPVTADAMREILQKAREAGADKRILVAGDAYMTEEGARVLAEAGVLLYGNESQTVGPESGPMAVHLILLGAGVVLLEGVVLTDVEEGKYFLSAAPLNLGGFEGAPCRAYLMR